MKLFERCIISGFVVVFLLLASSWVATARYEFVVLDTILAITGLVILTVKEEA